MATAVRQEKLHAFPWACTFSKGKIANSDAV